MYQFNEFADLEGLDIYRRIADNWQIAAIDRDIEFRELLFVPIKDGWETVGAAMLIGVLAYPDDSAKQENYVKHVAAWSIKRPAPPRSIERKLIKNDPGLAWAIEIPNKRIQQVFNDCSRQIAKRFRAAWLLCQKLSSNSDPSHQVPLNELIIKAAGQNARSYAAFYSTDSNASGQEIAIVDSFRRQVLYSARPVIHIAMVLYLKLETGDPKKLNLFELIQKGDQWLKKAVIASEIIRVSFGDMFPRHDEKHQKGQRTQNYAAPLKETISVLPYIDPIPEDVDFKWFLKNLRMSQQRPPEPK